MNQQGVQYMITLTVNILCAIIVSGQCVQETKQTSYQDLSTCLIAKNTIDAEFNKTNTKATTLCY
jgi:hypothetical protein